MFNPTHSSKIMMLILDDIGDLMTNSWENKGLVNVGFGIMVAREQATLPLKATNF